MNILQGKKTYSLVVAGILAAIAGYLGDDLDVAQTVEAILIALGFATVRHGIKTETDKQKKASVS